MEANRKRTQVHRLPTEQSHIVKDIGHGNLKLTYFSNIKSTKGWYECQHLYITTDEEIKEGDKCYSNKSNSIVEATCDISQEAKNNIGYWRKIIATTDPKLFAKGDAGIIEHTFKDGMHEIPQSFIEDYCKASGIDKVLVELEATEWHGDEFYGEKREAVRWDKPKTDSNNCIIIHSVEEKMYSIDDIEAYCDKYPNDTELGREIRKLRYKQ